MNEDILGQIYIAFGSGAWQLRVTRGAVAAIRKRYFKLIDKWAADWETDGVQYLERFRAIGRLSALKAAERGDTVITEEDFEAAAPVVEATSRTPNCPRP